MPTTVKTTYDNPDLPPHPTQRVVAARTPGVRDEDRRPVFTDAILSYCEHTRHAVCTDLDAELAEFNGETHHVHLLVCYPPTLVISTLVQRIKGCTAHAMHREFTGACVRARMRGHLWSRRTSPSPAAVHHFRPSSSTSTTKPDRSTRRAPPDNGRDGLTPD